MPAPRHEIDDCVAWLGRELRKLAAARDERWHEWMALDVALGVAVDLISGAGSRDTDLVSLSYVVGQSVADDLKARSIATEDAVKHSPPLLPGALVTLPPHR